MRTQQMAGRSQDSQKGKTNAWHFAPPYDSSSCTCSNYHSQRPLQSLPPSFSSRSLEETQQPCLPEHVRTSQASIRRNSPMPPNTPPMILGRDSKLHLPLASLVRFEHRNTNMATFSQRSMALHRSFHTHESLPRSLSRFRHRCDSVCGVLGL